MVVPDKDIINFVNFSASGTRFVLGGAISWLITNINRMLEAKKDALLRKRAGAVIASELKLIWTKTVKKAFHSADQRVQINKFNLMLEDTLADHNSCYLMDVDGVLHNDSLYTVHNTLNSHGQKAFWSEVDNQIEKFEKKQISLKPVR